MVPSAFVMSLEMARLGPDGDGGVTGAGQVLSLLMLSGGMRPTAALPSGSLFPQVSGLNACLLNIANFLVTSYTSPARRPLGLQGCQRQIRQAQVTLQVLGNVKSCLSIAVSVAIFRTNVAHVLDVALPHPAVAQQGIA